MILTGPEIRRQVELGKIGISNFNPRQLNPASYDVRLGNKIFVYDRQGSQVLDSRIPQPGRVTTFESIVIHPGRLYLMHTEEVIHTNYFEPTVDGKSSIGRIGVMVHVTAGYGEPGFRGQYTLEVSTLAHPVRLYAGMRIAQMRFTVLQGEIELYKGNYVEEASMGPVPSMSWKQFDQEEK